MDLIRDAGASPFPALSPERIAAARTKHGHAVDTYLEHLRMGDPLADELVICIERLERRQGVHMFLQALDKGVDSVDSPPRELVALFEELDRVPFWIDWERMNLASAKIMRNALVPAMTLAVYALPHAYLSTGNKPLGYSNALVNQTARRYAITTRFLTEVFIPGNMRRHADGFKFTAITRLLHARIRRKILLHDSWNPDWGVPLNQAHLAMGTIIFSFYVIDGMKRLGARVTDEEMNSILLVWRYVGYLFGINADVLCSTKAEARRLIEVAYSLEFDPDDDARRLCRALIESAPEFMNVGNQFLARKFVEILYALSRRLLGDPLADRLGYPKQKRHLHCMAGIALTGLFERVPWLVPPQLREYMGVSFWIERADYDLRAYGLDM